MALIDSETGAYRRVSYICGVCNLKRDAIIDEIMHLNRKELSTSGLAPYIDIHEDERNPGKGEHGMKLFIDHNFHVRSNSVMTNALRKPRNSNVPGLPQPKFSLNTTKMVYLSRSWNSLELSSTVHNVGFFIINPEPTSDVKDLLITRIESPLKTVSVNISFQKSALEAEFIDYCVTWLTYLIKWIEMTPSVNVIVIPRLIFYIDYFNTRSPTPSDELAISILLDSSAYVRMPLQEMDQDILKGKPIYPLDQAEKPRDSTLIGINLQAFDILVQVLKLDRYIQINEILALYLKHPTLKDQFIDTFVMLFIDLFRQDKLEYKVSYLM